MSWLWGSASPGGDAVVLLDAHFQALTQILNFDEQPIKMMWFPDDKNSIFAIKKELHAGVAG